MGKSQELKMIYSGLIPQKGKKAMARVVFERGNDKAEGVVPDGKIETSSGFSTEELRQLEDYLVRNSEDILRRAKEVNPLRNWMGKD